MLNFSSVKQYSIFVKLPFINLRYTDDTTLMAENEEELKSLLMKEESEKSGLKLNIQKYHGIWSHHFMANRWGNNGNSDKTLFSWTPKSL